VPAKVDEGAHATGFAAVPVVVGSSWYLGWRLSPPMPPAPGKQPTHLKHLKRRRSTRQRAGSAAGSSRPRTHYARLQPPRPTRAPR
jgi:hypothetical protein